MLNAPRGMMDVLPPDVSGWHYLEKKFYNLCLSYGYREIRTPIVEHTEVFQRGVGASTDVVEKEMYTFQDRGGRFLSLRPEGTAAIARAYIQHKMYALPQPVKMYYYGPMFRYDKPQAGRYRQFYQFGVEAFGTMDPLLDVEVIQLTNSFFRQIGLDDLILEVNSVGCPGCRPSYQEQLIMFLERSRAHLCLDCKRRLDINPLRVLDCKNSQCRALVSEAPLLNEHLCAVCRKHFDGLLQGLTNLQILYQVNPHLVRGLDYYTKTAFEFINPSLGTQNSLGGGGRYDGLVEACGGPATPGVGMALGIERILLTLQRKNIKVKTSHPLKVFVAVTDDTLKKKCWEFVYLLRGYGIYADGDYTGKSLRSQLKYANKMNFRFVILLGPEEVAKEKIIVKNMDTGTQEEVTFLDMPKYFVSFNREQAEGE